MSKIFISTLSKKQKFAVVFKGNNWRFPYWKINYIHMLYRMYKCTHWRTPSARHHSESTFSLNNLLGEPVTQCPPDQITSQINFCKGSSDYADPGNAVVAGWIKVRVCFCFHQTLSHLI